MNTWSIANLIKFIITALLNFPVVSHVCRKAWAYALNKLRGDKWIILLRLWQTNLQQTEYEKIEHYVKLLEQWLCIFSDYFILSSSTVQLMCAHLSSWSLKSRSKEFQSCALFRFNISNDVSQQTKPPWNIFGDSISHSFSEAWIETRYLINWYLLYLGNLFVEDFDKSSRL